MQNEFEKQVQQKMDELRFVPTPPVWEKIEAQIRRKKERRRFFFWLPLAVLCTGAAFWWIASGPAHSMHGNDRAATHAWPTTTQSTTTHASTPSSSVAQSSATEPSTTRSSSATITSTNTTPTADHTTTTLPAAGTNAATAPTQSLAKNKISVRSHTAAAPSKAQRARRSIMPAPARIYTGAVISAVKNNTAASPVEPLPTATSRPVPPAASPATGSPVTPLPANAAPAAGTVAPSAKTQAAPADTQAVVTAPVKKQGPPKAWRWGVTAAAGWSGMGRGLALATNKSADVQYNSPAVPRVPLATFVDPSAPSRHAAFEIGLSAERRLTNRLSLAAGLGYSYLSTAIGSGKRINALAASVTLTGPTYTGNAAHGGSYINRFHFLALPVSVQLRPLGRLPLEVHAGITARRLVASDALLYNSELQVYYKDHSAFRKTQLSSSLGLDYTFAGKRSAWRAGPQLEYGLSRVQNDGGQHWYSFGLRLQYFRDK